MRKAGESEPSAIRRDVSVNMLRKGRSMEGKVR